METRIYNTLCAVLRWSHSAQALSVSIVFSVGSEKFSFFRNYKSKETVNFTNKTISCFTALKNRNCRVYLEMGEMLCSVKV